MIFMYDPYKEEKNIEKHKIGFKEAEMVWCDPNLIVLNAKRRGERRFLAIGRAYSVLLSVVHTRRGDAIRIISARRSTEKERRLYESHRAD